MRESGHGLIKALSLHFLGGTQDVYEIFQVSRCCVRNSNRVSPEYTYTRTVTFGGNFLDARLSVRIC
jgi:hypothetical protein